MEKLQIGDRIYIRMDLDANHGDSKIHSEEKMPSIHFVGQKISDWILTEREIKIKDIQVKKFRDSNNF